MVGLRRAVRSVGRWGQDRRAAQSKVGKSGKENSLVRVMGALKQLIPVAMESGKAFPVLGLCWERVQVLVRSG